MTWRKYVIWLPFLLLLSVMLTPLGEISYSAEIVTISVDPSLQFVELGEDFNVSLTIKNAVDVYGWQVNLTFNPNVVNVTDAVLPADHFLSGRPEGDVGLQYTIFNRSIVLGTAILGDYEGLHGSGVLAIIEFEVLATGESVLGIDDTPGIGAWTYLADSVLVYTVPPDVETKDGYVSNLDSPPTASFITSPSVPDLGETVTFDASASSDSDGNIVRYEWDFGDDNYANETGPTTTHAYTTAGDYTATLTVFDDAIPTQVMMDTFNTTIVPRAWYEAHSVDSKEIEIKAAHDIIVKSASASPTTVTVGDSVTISITVENNGLETETFNVEVYYGTTTLAIKAVENLAPDAEETVQVTWDTTDVALGTHVIKVEAPVTGDANPTDNSLTNGSVRVQEEGAGFPMEYVIIGVVVVGVIGIAAFFFLRKGKSPAT